MPDVEGLRRMTELWTKKKKNQAFPDNAQERTLTTHLSTQSDGICIRRRNANPHVGCTNYDYSRRLYAEYDNER